MVAFIFLRNPTNVSRLTISEVFLHMYSFLQLIFLFTKATDRVITNENYGKTFGGTNVEGYASGLSTNKNKPLAKVAVHKRE